MVAPLSARHDQFRACIGSSASKASRAFSATAPGCGRRAPARTGAMARRGHRQAGDPEPDQHRRRAAGSAAASPHTPTGLPARRPAAAQAAISCSSAGCHGSSRSARSPRCRSAAKVYWLRSLVPMLRKSTSSAGRSGAQRGGRDLHHRRRHCGSPGARHRAGELGRLGRGGHHRAPSPTTSAPVAAGRLGDRVELGVQHARAAAGHPQAADAEGRIGLVGAGSGTAAACPRPRRGCGPRPCAARRGAEDLPVGGDLLLAAPAPRVRSRKRNSVRNSPTPSASTPGSPAGRARRADVEPAARPGGRRRSGPGPARGGQPRPARLLRVAGSPRDASARVRRSTSPVAPSTGDRTSRRRRPSTPGAGDHGGQPEGPGQDRGVAGRAALLGDQGQHPGGSRPAVSAGARSSATRTNGCPGRARPASAGPARRRPPGPAGRPGRRRARPGIRRPPRTPPVMRRSAASIACAASESPPGRPSVDGLAGPGRRPIIDLGPRISAGRRGRRGRPAAAASASAATAAGRASARSAPLGVDGRPARSRQARAAGGHPVHRARRRGPG